MPQPLPIPSKYGISEDRGFLSSAPVQVLSNTYYAPWEKIVADIQPLLLGGRLRETIQILPVLSTAHLHDELEWRRAYLVLVAMLQGYIWVGPGTSDRVPPSITIPLMEVCEYVELPPVATYAGFCLWNYRPLFQADPTLGLSNLKCGVSFTGSMDEQWFYHVSMAIEAHGASAIPLMLGGIEAARVGDSQSVINSLVRLYTVIGDITNILQRMHDKCDPRVFYRQIRPFFAGSEGMEDSGLPYGIWYDDGVSPKQYRKYAGISNAQSSLIQFLDIVLGIEHRPTSLGNNGEDFLKKMRQYMPGPHRRFLEHVEEVANIRQYVESHTKADEALVKAYDSCLEALRLLRDKHLQIVYRYVILESRATAPPQSTASLGSRESTKAKEHTPDGLIGTGGTTLMPFLKQVRDETTEPAIQSRLTPQRYLGGDGRKNSTVAKQMKVDHSVEAKDGNGWASLARSSGLNVTLILPVALWAAIFAVWSAY